MIKLVCFDFDGVFTDSKYYVSNEGFTIKTIDAKDNHGIKLLKDAGIRVGIISGSNLNHLDVLSKMNNFNKLDFYVKGCDDKSEELIKWKNLWDLEWHEIAYMGDDVIDLECLKKVGLGACPKDAVSNVKEVCSFISRKKGGNGAVREFIDFILL